VRKIMRDSRAGQCESVGMVRVSAAVVFAIGVLGMFSPGCGNSSSDTAGAGNAGASGQPSSGGALASGGTTTGGTFGSAGNANAGRGGSVGLGGSGGGAATGGTGTTVAGSTARDTGGSAGRGGDVSGGDAGASAGDAGSGGAANSAMHCTPGEPKPTYPSAEVVPCYGDYYTHDLPNPYDINLRDFHLDAPAVGGEPFAFSTRTAGIGPFEIEIWGANEECGQAEELLWTGPMVNGIQCGEFTPAKTYTHLLYVYRKMRNQSYSFSMPELALCPNGSCPSGAAGEGRTPGQELAGVPFVYAVTDYSPRNAFELRLGTYGNLVAFVDGTKAPSGMPTRIKQGVLRLHEDDPFGDGWYCIGEGSTITATAESATFAHDATMKVSLENLTKLPACSTLTGSGTASIALSESGDTLDTITSSFSAFSGSDFIVNRRDCIGTDCSFDFDPPDGRLMLRYLFLKAEASVGSFFEPTGVPTPVTDAILFTQSDTGELTIACASSGTITYDPTTMTSIELNGMPTVHCPGEPVSVDHFDFTTRTP
jgi:hypothetical protein